MWNQQKYHKATQGGVKQGEEQGNARKAGRNAGSSMLGWANDLWD